MSVYSIPVNNELPGLLLLNMLSIKEALLVVTRVGFVIHGYIEEEYIISANSCDGPCASIYSSKIYYSHRCMQPFYSLTSFYLVYQSYIC